MPRRFLTIEHTFEHHSSVTRAWCKRKGKKMVSAAKYNRRALGDKWMLTDLPVEWEGYATILSGDTDNDQTIDDEELDEIDWQEFSDEVRDFQSQSNLTVDGKLGPNTLKQLLRHYIRDTGQEGPDKNLLTVGDLTFPRPSTPTAPPAGERIMGENRSERAVCNLWNKYGGAIAREAQRFDLPVDSALAVFYVESKNAYDPKTGLLIIRFEPHVFKRKSGKEINWSRGKQEAEWRNFTRASEVNQEAALLSCSYGLPQLMGFNWGVTEHDGPKSMVMAFQDSCIEQVKGFFGYVKSRKLAKAIQERDWRTFARKYNGAGRVDIYSTNLGKAMRTIEELKSEGHTFGV